MCVDDELDRLGRELFDLLNEGAGSGRLGVSVDDEDDVVEEDDRGVAIDFVGGLGNGGGLLELFPHSPSFVRDRVRNHSASHR